MSYQPPASFEELLQRWLKRLRESQFAHYEVAASLVRLHYYFGLPVIILTTVVGTSVFASLGENTNLSTNLQIGIGLLSVAAAVLASLQTFLKFSERAEKHRSVGARYGSIRREIEQLLVTTDFSVDKLDEILEDLRSKIDSLSAEAPEISSRIYQRIQKNLNET